ncbi:hypothetical protein HYC85_014957 [Camellia sinensis]|uniref:Uncharacterized protein n=1 Tax=Camellia sinensis TaxID=4442 RepID=A0A7J7H7U3_CAMSI|nr:hypothetical protein HYC85_014957 [Camellia sinensis]
MQTMLNLSVTRLAAVCAVDHLTWVKGDALVAGNCNRIHITMRFLTVMMCSKVLQPISLVVVYETLLSSAATRVDEERGNPSWQACADFYITCIPSCLPWGGAELVEVSIIYSLCEALFSNPDRTGRSDRLNREPGLVPVRSTP